MPKIFFTGKEDNEQAVGGTLYNGRMKLYAVRRDKPLDMVFLGGHRISDALTYNITEAVMVPEYVSEDGENTVLEVYVSNDTVKSINFNLELPNKSIPAATRILQTQKSCTWDLLFVPDDCGSGCESFFWLGRNLRLGSFQMTNAPVGFDDTKSAITRISVARLTGQLLQYNGVTTKTLPSAGGALYDVVISSSLCEGCDCPYQTMYRGGAAGLVEESTDGGATWTALTTTVIGTDAVTSLAIVNDRLLAGHADANDASAILGGATYNVGGVMTSAVFYDSAGVVESFSPVVQALVPVGGSVVYAFGALSADGIAAGNAYIAKSCDGGLTYTAIDQTTITAQILSADFDAKTGNMFIGTLGNGGVYVWDFDSFEDETATVGAGAVDTLSIEITGEDNVAIGFSDGQFWENFSYEAGGAWVGGALFSSPVFASAGDFYNYRTLVGAGSSGQIRDGYNYQVFEEVISTTGNITAISEGKTLLDEGTNFFVLVTDTGETFLVTQCNLCIESC